MDFFEHQDVARKNTSLLIFYFTSAVILIVAAIYFTFAWLLLDSEIDAAGYDHLWDAEIFIWTVGCATMTIAMGSLFKMSQLAAGGEVIARMLGGTPISRDTKDTDKRKILNVVDEMAIASGTPPPPVFLIEHETSINAFAAGFTLGDAVMGITQGAIETLTRDELQGVVAHEFSHILNGDMRLNIRLTGILHGILIIGITGYATMYATSRASSARSDSKDAASLIVLGFWFIGLMVTAIGFIGLFFGKLIRAAVSRQREFLADASSVQFTRNPTGIAGALKKIAGWEEGSHITSTKAEEVSHIFFGNALGSTFLNMMATHPPLDERIRRIESSETTTKIGTPGTGPSGSATAAAGFAGTATTHAISPAKVIASVGSPRNEHIKYAGTIIGSLPVTISKAAQEPTGAIAILYSLLLDKRPEIRSVQVEHLNRHAGNTILRAMINIAPNIKTIETELRLPLAHLAISPLKNISQTQYKALTATLRHLVEADGNIDLFEYTMQCMITRNLVSRFEPSSRTSITHHRLSSLMPSIAGLLSCLSYWGTKSEPLAHKAFAKGISELSLSKKSTILPKNKCSLITVDKALKDLASASPRIKKRVLTACVACVCTDGLITVSEAELLRAIADSLECPIPPFLPNQKTESTRSR